MVVSIATKKSRQLIKDSVKAEASGEKVDWDKVFIEVYELEAHGKDEQIKAIMEKKK